MSESSTEARHHIELATIIDPWTRETAVEQSKFIRQLYDDATRDILNIDFLYLLPETLVMVWRVREQGDSLKLSRDASALGFRVLDLESLSEDDRKRFDEKNLARVSWYELESKNLDRALNALLNAMGQGLEHKREKSKIEVCAPLNFHIGEKKVSAMAKALSDRVMFIASPHLPDVGEELVLELGSKHSQGPLPVRACVLSVSNGEEGEESGFEVTLPVRSKDLNVFEAFMIAVSQNQPWPGPSGRRFQRFPFELSVEFQWGDETVQATSVDVSRGGVFVRTESLLPVGSQVGITGRSDGRLGGVRLGGRVVRVVSRSTKDSTEAGLGIEFSEEPMVVREKLRLLLGEVLLLAQKNALVIDDDRFFRTVIGNTLKTAGYHVTEASDGRAGIDALVDGLMAYDVVVVDWHMPNMNGLDFAKKARDMGGSDMTIALLSGVDSKEKQYDGIDVVLSKASAPQQIISQIEHAQLRRSIIDTPLVT